jgi:polar amino acid transport system substrate-binding protein
MKKFSTAVTTATARTILASLVAGMAALAATSLLPASATAQSLDRFRTSGVVQIGHRIDARPFSFMDSDGRPAGYTVELCDRIVEALSAAVGRDLETKYVALGAEERFQAVAEGRVDLHCGAATATLSRRETVSFSLPIFVTGVSAVLSSDAPRFLVDLLAGRTARPPTRETVRESMREWTFAVRSGTTAETWLRGALDTLAPRASVVTVGDHAEGIAGVAAETFDAYFADRALLQGQLQAFESTEGFILSERLFTHEPYGIVLPRGNEDLRLIVDRTLSRLYRSGEYRELFEKYFGRPDAMQSLVLSISALPE